MASSTAQRRILSTTTALSGPAAATAAAPATDPAFPIAAPGATKLAVGVAAATGLTGLGRSFLYELMAQGELPFVRIGARRLLLVSDLAALLQRFRRGTPGPTETPTVTKVAKDGGPLPDAAGLRNGARRRGRGERAHPPAGESAESTEDPSGGTSRGTSRARRQDLRRGVRR
jgi:excisionase family DNA binding protein